jgi:hypothetical protein
MHLDLSGLWRVRQARAIAALADTATADLFEVVEK